MQTSNGRVVGRRVPYCERERPHVRSWTPGAKATGAGSHMGRSPCWWVASHPEIRTKYWSHGAQGCRQSLGTFGWDSLIQSRGNGELSPSLT